MTFTSLIFIFTFVIKGMRYCKYLIILTLGLVFRTGADAQSVFFSTSGDGCGSLTAVFSIEPSNVYDTIISISWSFSDGGIISGEKNPEHTFLKAGVYYATAQINSSSTLVSDPVLVFNQPEAAIGYSDSTGTGMDYSYVFAYSGKTIDSLIYSYSWDFEDGETANDRRLLHSFPGSGVYDVSLVVETNQGCVDSITIPFSVNEILEVPNVFTPNMDGYNDYFKVKTNGQDKYVLSIYSRSGALVYKSEAEVISWDGRSMSGTEMATGLYYYVIEQLEGESSQERTGFVQLYR